MTIWQIKHGGVIAKETSEAFKEIVEKIKKSSNIIGEMAVSIREQSDGIDQVAEAMGQIGSVTQ